MIKRKYFDKKGKTETEIASHTLKKANEHKTNMRKRYRANKIKKNKDVLEKFNQLYEFVGGFIDIGDLSKDLEKITDNKLRCKCFNKLYEAYLKANEYIAESSKVDATADCS